MLAASAPPTLPMSAVLAAMRRDPDGEWHAADLMRAAGLASGSLYVALHGLQRRGWVTRTQTDAGTPAPGRYRYAITPLAVHTDSAHDAGTRSRRAVHAAGWVVAAIVALVQAAEALSCTGAQRMPDLGVYVGAVSGLRHGASLYDFVDGNDAPFTYPPFAGMLFWPLTYVARGPLDVAWTAATIAIVLGLAVYVARDTRLPAPLTAIVLLLSAPVSSNLRFGQVSVALAALVVLDIAVLRATRWHGVLTGVAAAIKLTPLIFIPLLWRAGRRRAALVATATFAVCAAIGYAAAPNDSRRFWGTAMWHVERLGHVTVSGNQSVDGALMRLGFADPGRSLVAMLIAGTVAVLALRRAGWAARAGDWFSAIVIVGAACVVASPVSWTHHQIWLVMAAGLPVAAGASARRAWPLLVLAVMLLPVTTIGAKLGWPPLEDARLLLAVAIACLVPIAAHSWRPPPAARRGNRTARQGPGQSGTARAGTVT
jgi:alpha-1,2-mannosyltransferase